MLQGDKLLYRPMLLTLLFFTSCKVPSKLHESGYIIDSNDIKTFDAESSTIDFDQKLFDHTALIIIDSGNGRKRFCSGSIIAPKNAGNNYRILSNHHCFAKKDENGIVQSALLEGHCDEVNIVFGAYKDSGSPKEFTSCKVNTFFSDIDMDLAVFEIAKNPSPKYTPIKFASNNMSLSKQDSLVIHYPKVEDTDSEIKEKTFIDTRTKVRAPYAQYTAENCRTTGMFPEEQRKLDKALGFSIRHTCDQIDGSSGSPLISRQNGLLLGVNWGGIELVDPKTSESRKINVATSIENIKLFLSGDYEEHKKEIFEKAEAAFKNYTNRQNSSGNALVNGCGIVGGSGKPALLLFLSPLSLILIRERKKYL